MDSAPQWILIWFRHCVNNRIMALSLGFNGVIICTIQTDIKRMRALLDDLLALNRWQKEDFSVHLRLNCEMLLFGCHGRVKSKNAEACCAQHLWAPELAFSGVQVKTFLTIDFNVNLSLSMLHEHHEISIKRSSVILAARDARNHAWWSGSCQGGGLRAQWSKQPNGWCGPAVGFSPNWQKQW